MFAFVIRALGGRTVAGRLLGLRIVRRSDGAPIGDGRAIVRLLGLFLTLILWPVSLIVTLVGREHRTPADALAGTVVIKRTKAPTDALSS